MNSELDAIQERLRALKRRLDAREAVIDVDAAEPDRLAVSARESTD